jgi:hypothetical protein
MTTISKRRGVLSSAIFAGFLIGGSALAATPALAAWDSIASAPAIPKAWLKAKR